MADLLFLGIIVAFFTLMVLLVRFCERIVGKDVTPASPSTDPSALASSEVTA